MSGEGVTMERLWWVDGSGIRIVILLLLKPRGEALTRMNSRAEGSDPCGGGRHDVIIVISCPEVT